MRIPLQLVATLLLNGAMVMQAQITNPDNLIASPPKPPVHRHASTEDNLQWLWQYTLPTPDGSENRMLGDPHFAPFLRSTLNAPQSFWGNKPLSEVAIEFLAVPGQVIADDNRYITTDGCVAHFCPDRGLLWIDLHSTQPFVVFAAIDWNKENRATDDQGATYTMWVFTNRAIDPAQVPSALIRSIGRWTALPASGSQALQDITHVFLVDPDGTPHTISPNAIGAHNSIKAQS